MLVVTSSLALLFYERVFPEEHVWGDTILFVVEVSDSAIWVHGFSGVQFKILPVLVEVLQSWSCAFLEFGHFVSLPCCFQFLHDVFDETLHLVSEVFEVLAREGASRFQTATVDDVDDLASGTFFEILLNLLLGSVCSRQLDFVSSLGREGTSNLHEAGLSWNILNGVSVRGHLISRNNALVDLHFVFCSF